VLTGLFEPVQHCVDRRLGHRNKLDTESAD
jgi:hypothetical protein